MDVSCVALPAALKALASAATVIVTGSCGPYLGIGFAPSGTSLDFSQATVSRLDISGVTGPLTIQGFVSVGTTFAAINVRDSNHILIDHARCIEPGATCVGVDESDQIEISGPYVSRSRGDGVDIAGSTNVSVHDGTCEDNEFPPGDHPDCVQVWSSPRHLTQHITIQRMVARGQMDGFDNFGPNDGNEVDFKVLDNLAEINFANCVVFINVKALVVKGNRCVTTPGGKVGPAVVKVIKSPDAVVRSNRDGR